MTTYLVIVEVAPSARKHGIADEDMIHAVRHALTEFPQEYDDRIGIIGPGRAGGLLEVVVLDPDDDPVVIHAMTCRPKFYGFL